MGILDDLYGLNAQPPALFNAQTGFSPGLLGNVALGLISAGTTPQRVPQSSLNTILRGVAQGVNNYGNQLVQNRQLQQQNLTNYLQMQKTGLEIEKQKQALMSERLFNERINQMFGSNPAAMLAASQKDITGAVELMGGGAQKPATPSEIINLRKEYTPESISAYLASPNRDQSLLKFIKKEETEVEKLERIKAEKQLKEIEEAPQKEKQEAIKREEALIRYSEGILDAIERIEPTLSSNPFDLSYGGGRIGVLSRATGGGRAEAQLLGTLQAKIAFKTLQEIREQSKTGGGLGSISERELDLLAGAEGALGQDLSDEQLRETLAKLRKDATNVAVKSQRTINELRD